MQLCDYLEAAKRAMELAWRKGHTGLGRAIGQSQTGTDAYAAKSTPSARKKANDRETVLSIGGGSLLELALEGASGQHHKRGNLKA